MIFYRLLILFLPIAAFSEYCFFIPPKEWQMADPKTLSPRVQIGFIGKNKRSFCPSINLAIEECKVTIGEYLDAVKKLHEMDRNNRWRKLGIIHTPAGDAHLTEIDTKVECGAVRLLQLILLREEKAYILTTAALKEEAPKYYQIFQDAFKSLTLTHDLYSAISSDAKREALKERAQKLKSTAALIPSEEFHRDHWLPFQKAVIEEFSDLGAHWQALYLQMVQKKMDLLHLRDND